MNAAVSAAESSQTARRSHRRLAASAGARLVEAQAEEEQRERERGREHERHGRGVGAAAVHGDARVDRVERQGERWQKR